VLQKLGIGRIATITGRYYAMDRDTNWERTQLAYDALFEGKGRTYQNKTISEIIDELYAQNETDEFFKPCILLNENGKPSLINKNDGVFFFNFRPDRARQISYLIEKVVESMHLTFVTLSQYDQKLKAHVAFMPLEIKTTLGEEISKAGLTQAHIAETEKYAHLTYFLNGGKEEPYDNEENVLIPSQKVATHDLAPEMRAKEIADKVIEHIDKGTNVIMINFANADMVGHVGNLPATIEAIKVLDTQLERIVTSMQNKGGVTFITADHGNAEQQYDDKIGQKHTAHTLNPVPAILTDKSVQLQAGSLEDVAPTILQLLGLPKPQAMTGKSLIEE
jgi:2,3-bisphosphoglycerate-independent phosphoglycerate mutase